MVSFHLLNQTIVNESYRQQLHHLRMLCSHQRLMMLLRLALENSENAEQVQGFDVAIGAVLKQTCMY